METKTWFMKRKNFIRLVSAVSLAVPLIKFKFIEREDFMYNETEKMPILFVGHGSPMNAIEDNDFSRTWAEVAKNLPKPKAVLCISAHWETAGTWLTAMDKPETIHDFGGFPKALYDVIYPAPGEPGLAAETRGKITTTEAGLDYKWGLDHGCWSVLKRFYPKADIPIIQMSLDYNKSARFHYDLATELAFLRKQGVLIVGSGNIVHNLGMVAWNRLNDKFGYDWALEAREKIKADILAGDHKSLIDYQLQGKAFQYSIPTPEHYLPLLYILALKGKNENVHFFNDDCVAGSLAMTSLKIS
jgi:4,5-DOPA dioxygenase extradiol